MRAPPRPPPRARALRALWLLALLALLAAASPTYAQAPPAGDAGDDPAPARLAPPVVHARWELGPLSGCATAESLSEDVARTLGRDPFVGASDEPDARLRVVARQDSIEAWVLALHVEADGGEGDRVRRVFPGRVSCPAARGALVEMIALAVDYALVRPPAPAPRVQAPFEPEPRRAPPPERWSLRAGVDASVGRGLLPGTHGGLALGLALAPPRTGWSVGVEATGWAPGVASTNETRVPVGIRIWAWHVSLRGCHRFLVGAPLELQVCAGGVVGQVVEDRSFPQSEAVVGLGGARRLLGVDGDVGLLTSSRAPVQLALRLGVLAPLSLAGGGHAVCSDVEPRCSAGSEVVVLHEPAWLVPRFQLGLRWRLR